MYVPHTPGTMYQYMCSNCNYEREGLLDHPSYSCRCPRCGGYYKSIPIKKET